MAAEQAPPAVLQFKLPPSRPLLLEVAAAVLSTALFAKQQLPCRIDELSSAVEAAAAAKGAAGRLARKRARTLDQYDTMLGHIHAALAVPIASLTFLFGPSLANARSAIVLRPDNGWMCALTPATPPTLAVPDLPPPPAATPAAWSGVLSAPSTAAGAGAVLEVRPSAFPDAVAALWGPAADAQAAWEAPSAWTARTGGAVARKTVRHLLAAAGAVAAPAKLGKCWAVLHSPCAVPPPGWAPRPRLRLRVVGKRSPPPVQLPIASAAWEAGTTELAAAACASGTLPDSLPLTCFLADGAVAGVA